MTAETTKAIGVFPRGELERRPRLAAALEQAFAVSLTGRENGELRGLDGALVFGNAATGETLLRAGVPTLLFEAPADPRGEPAVVTIEPADPVDRILRGLRLPDRNGTATLNDATPGELVLARSERSPLWTRSPGETPLDRAGVAPRELAETESLRDLLLEGDFVSLLPLVHYLRERTAGIGWKRPALRAAFVLDDPNLHWPSYGYVRFDELAQHAREHRYHVAMATIPLDAWYVNRRAAHIFRSHPAELSLAMHGNDHVRGELARATNAGGAQRLLGQALRRAASLERRAGVPVSRVMVAPHEVCSDETMWALADLGFDALCFGWGVRTRSRLLASWGASDFLAGGLPVLPRRPFGAGRGELALRGFLGQPLIVSGHHDTLREGLDVLADLAATINALGSVAWLSLGDIAASNLEKRSSASQMEILLFTRRAVVDVPADVKTLAVELPVEYDSDGEDVIVVSSGTDESIVQLHGRRATVEVEGGDTVNVRLRRSAPLEHDSITRPPRQTLGAVRRGLTESRDRLAPALRLRRPRSRG